MKALAELSAYVRENRLSAPDAELRTRLDLLGDGECEGARLALGVMFASPRTRHSPRSPMALALNGGHPSRAMQTRMLVRQKPEVVARMVTQLLRGARCVNWDEVMVVIGTWSQLNAAERSRAVTTGPATVDTSHRRVRPNAPQRR